MTPKYTQEQIIKMAKRWKKVHGRAPSSRQWRHADYTSDTPHPATPTVADVFGSWSNFMAAAGFPPNKIGRPKGSTNRPKANPNPPHRPVKNKVALGSETVAGPTVDFDWARLETVLDTVIEHRVNQAIQRAMGTHKLLQDIAATPDTPAANGHTAEPGFFRRLIRA